MNEYEKILSTEYPEKFDELSKNRIVVSHYKYGPIRDNYGPNGTVDAAGCLKLDPKYKYGSLERCLEKYHETGNLEYLVDVGNYARIEFMCPQHPNAHFSATDSKESAGQCGMSFNEIKEFAEAER